MNCVPWCAIFVSYCISHSGHEWKYSYVPAICGDAVQGKNGMSVTYHPEPGDLVAYTFHGQVDCHTAFFDGCRERRPPGLPRRRRQHRAGELLQRRRGIESGQERSLVHRFIRLTL